MTSEEKRLWAVERLCKKSNELGRLPKTADFDDVTRSRIKAFLGPWPRALETAGLKEAKPAAPKKKKRSAKAKAARNKALRKLEYQETQIGKENAENNK